MDDDGAHEGMNEVFAFVAPVGEVAQRLQRPRKLRGRWRNVQESAALVLHDDVFVGTTEAACRGGFGQRAIGEHALDFEHGIGRQRPPQPSLEFAHGLEVVGDHAFAVVAWRAARAQHVLGDLGGGRCAFQLRGGHRLLHQRADQAALAQGGARNRIGALQRACGVACDQEQPALNAVDGGEGEGHALLVAQWKFLAERLPSHHCSTSSPAGGVKCLRWSQCS